MTQCNIAVLALFLVVAAPLVPKGTRASAAPACPKGSTIKDQVVSAYFAALDREDYKAALGRTSGQAYALTANIVGELQRESAKRHVRVDIATRRVEIATPAEGPVRVRFDIDVLGRFMFFHKKMKSLHGEAAFSVDEKGQIVNIAGDLGL